MSRTRIVVVDDDLRMLRLLKRTCGGAGCEVHAVHDAEFVESSLRAFEPAVVFLDLEMPSVDGTELLRRIASERPQTRIVLISGVEGRLLRAAYSLGMSMGLNMLAPLRKPIVVRDVHQRLSTFHHSASSLGGEVIGPTALGEAITRGRLEVVYQPLVDLKSHRMVCVEALARLRRPDGSLVMPGQFIPVAERCQLIDELTFSVLDLALEDLAAWSSLAPQLTLAVNMSQRLLCDAGLAGRIEACLRKHGLAPQRLTLEITETTAPDDRALMAGTLKALRHAGVRLALDDFGTGLCSVGQLYELPVETLKLDRNFAMRARVNAEAAATIRATLSLARQRGLTVVVEGIQDEETLRWLARMGCDVGQGFHISPPLWPDALDPWLAAGSGIRHWWEEPLRMTAS